MSTHDSDVRLPSEPTRRGKAGALIAVALVLGVLIGLAIANQAEDSQPLEAGVLTDLDDAAGDDPFEVYSDAVADGMPVYVLFHSGGCPPCIEAEKSATRILPDYAGRIIYVSAHTVDPRSRPLFDEFSFRSVPTSFFVDAAGEAVDQNVGPLSDEDLRSRLDALARD